MSQVLLKRRQVFSTAGRLLRAMQSSVGFSVRHASVLPNVMMLGGGGQVRVPTGGMPRLEYLSGIAPIEPHLMSELDYILNTNEMTADQKEGASSADVDNRLTCPLASMNIEEMLRQFQSSARKAAPENNMGARLNPHNIVSVEADSEDGKKVIEIDISAEELMSFIKRLSNSSDSSFSEDGGDDSMGGRIPGYMKRWTAHRGVFSKPLAALQQRPPVVPSVAVRSTICRFASTWSAVIQSVDGQRQHQCYQHWAPYSSLVNIDRVLHKHPGLMWTAAIVGLLAADALVEYIKEPETEGSDCRAEDRSPPLLSHCMPHYNPSIL